jgi:folate-binding protein YgfZ
MEDITVELLDIPLSLEVGPLSSSNNSKSFFKTSWCNEDAFFILEDVSLNSSLLNELEESRYLLSTGWPSLGKTLSGDELVNETRLNELAVDYKKGCFLGQETAAKIESRRGAAKYPSLVELLSGESFEHPSFKRVWGDFETDGKRYALIQLPREERVHNKVLELENRKYKVYALDQSISSKYDRAETLFLNAVEFFQKREDQKALELLDRAIRIDPSYADAYESKGAILGQMDKFNEAISVMDELLKVDEHSVMAHTNKSLFYMKIGEIEKAEDEKSLATVASFQRLGEEAKVKKQIAAEEEKQISEMNRRESMFKQVLEMDEKDAIANYGMADILFYRKEFKKSYDHLIVVLEENEKYSTAYTLLGKVCEELALKEKAIETYEKGISIASVQGDMMPANEMQSRLNQLRSES